MGGFRSKDLFSVLEARKSKTRMLADLVSGKKPLPGSEASHLPHSHTHTMRGRWGKKREGQAIS